ncbi:unnamed protein product [Calypogeia fissa]
MGRPSPKVLFSQSFRHYHPGEHVDEVRFSEPVVITACEILEQQTSSLCRSISLNGASSPQSFSIEIFVRSGGDARFKRLCHAFLYSASAPALLDAQVAVTDHLVLRGTYDSLTLVVYGNLASQIGQAGIDRNLGSELPDLLPSEVSCRFEDLPEALHPQRAKVGTPFGPLKYLHLVKVEKENAELIQKVLQLAGQTGRASFNSKSLHKVVKSLVSAAASLHISESRLPNVACFDFWPAFSKPSSSEESEQKKGLSLLLDAKKDLCELLGLPQEKEEDKSGGHVRAVEGSENLEKDEVNVKSQDSDAVLELILHWIQSSVHLRDVHTSALLSVERLIGGLAAAQLLCTDARECYRFVLAGGLHLLLDVLQHVVGNFSATTLLALGAVECASRYAFGCDALLGWWIPNTALCRESWESRVTCQGYSVLLKFLLQPQQRPIVLLAARVLHRLRTYELTAAIQPIVEDFIKEPGSLQKRPRKEESEGKAIEKSTVLIKQILRLLTAREISVKEGPSTRLSHWLALDGEDGGSQLPPSAAYGAIPSTTSIISRRDIDPHLLSVLQERRMLPMLVALLSAPRLRSLHGQATKSCTELVGAIEALLLALLSCRSGLLFLAHDPEVSRNLLASFQRIQELHEKDLPPLRHTIALTTAGFLCDPHDLGGMFQTCLSVISAMDRLLGACQESEESMWALWELCTISRLQSGRQALLTLTWFPEVVTLLVGSVYSDSEVSPGLVFGKTWRSAAVNFVAEVLQVVVSDAAAPTVAAWTPHAVAMQRALLANTAEMDETLSGNAGGYEIKNGACSGLLEWLDSAVVYHKKGAVGLLKHASAILAGGLPSVDTMEIDANVGDQAINNDLANAAGPYQAKWAGQEVTTAPLTDAAIVQMTVAFRILALVSCYPGVATVLYGEGAMAIVCSVLDQCSTALQSTSSAYDATMDEEDIEFDVTADNLGDHAKEQLLLGLVLPALLFLLALLQNLQAAVRNYQNTKLVDLLLLLHQQMSSRIASYVSAPPYAWSGITQEFIAVRQVLASVLVCWPIFEWAPPLFPRLLRLDNSSTTNPVLPPMEPAATCSVLSLLVDMLPTESPQLCNSKSSLSDMYRSLAVDNVLGAPSASAVRWHTCSPHSDELLRAFGFYLDQIGEVVTQNTSTVCGVLRDMLKLFIIRLACINADHAATILRPVINKLRDQNAANITGSEIEIMQVEHTAQIVAGLALHPASKAVLLREGVVEVFLNACKIPSKPLIGDESSSSDTFDSAATGPWLWIVRSFVALCDPDISLAPLRPLSRRIMEDCPNFGDCCSIVSWLLTYLQVLAIGKDFEVVLEALEKISRHKLGRAAIGYASLRRQDKTNPVEEVPTDSGKSQAMDNCNVPEVSKENTEEHQIPIFGGLLRRIQIAMESDNCDGTSLIGIIRRFAKLAITLSAAGKSTCGVAALSSLFGMGQEVSTEKSGEEKLGSVVSIAATLRKYTIEVGSDRISATNISYLSSVPGPVIEEAYTGLMTILRVLRRPEIGKEMIEKGIHDIKGLTVASAADNTSRKRVEWRLDGRLNTALVLSTNEHVESEKDESNSDESPPEKGSEATGSDSKGVLVWECPTVPQDRPRSSSKRKAMAMIEVSRKRPGMDTSAASTPPIDGMPPNTVGSTPVSGRPLPASATTASALNRRDTFRQRKPNTSRPPSMHVDDYVARERSEVGTSGSSPAAIQRSTSGSGRPPSIHVDEFMAKQQERQQLSATNSGIDDHHLSRNSSLPALDAGRKGHSGLAKPTNKTSEEDGQRSTTPQDKGSEQQWEELSIAESAAVAPGVSSENREASHRGTAAPSTTADVKSEKTSSSSSSMSTTTDSVHSAKTPQVADMLLLQSKVTLQTSVARNQAGDVQTQKEEVVQTVSGLAAEQVHLRDISKKASGTSTLNVAHSVPDKIASIPFHSWPSEPQSSSRFPGGDRHAVQPPSTKEKASEPQAAKNVQATTGFPPPHDLQPRDIGTPIRGMDAQNPVHLSSMRETRQLPSPSVHSTRQPKEPTTPVLHRKKEPQANVFTEMPRHGSQALQMSSPMDALEHRSLQSTPVTDPSSGFDKVSSSYATDPRPRPRDKHGERTATDVSRKAVPPPPPPPASPWRPDAVQNRLESTLPSPLANLLSARPGATPYPALAGPTPQWPPGEAIAKGTPLSNTAENPWPVHVPNAVYVDENGVPYSIPGRSTQAPANSPLPVGHNTPHHGSMQFPTAVPSPLPTPLNTNLPSAPVSYIPPPLPAGRPTTPHSPSLPVNNPPLQQQQLHLHFQQQNAMKLQQQQLQLRQHQLMQHAQPQQVQQLHQQHLLGPLPMQGQVPLPAPPPVPQTPPAPAAPTPSQPQQRTQPQESSAMLQQMLASPDAIQALLKDQNKLRELLEKHPKLISLLQERMG